jgi:hypothetical protein
MYIINKMADIDEWEDEFTEAVRKVNSLKADIDNSLRSNDDSSWDGYHIRLNYIKHHLRNLKNSFPRNDYGYKYNHVQDMIEEPTNEMDILIRDARRRIRRSRTRNSVRPGGSRKRTVKRKSSKQGQTKRKQTKRRQSRI